MPKITIMAGGTGGHVFPGLALADELQSRGWDVHWIGTADKMEATSVPAAGYPIDFIRVRAMRGKSVLTKLLTPFVVLKAIYQALRILRQQKPDVCLGMGGYASGPSAVAAKLLGIPLVVHEQNAIVGLTNRMLAFIADRFFCGFNLSESQHPSRILKQAIFVGNPVRKNFLSGQKADIDPSHYKLLIVGGSLGALALNQAIPPILQRLRGEFSFSVVHQTGQGKAEPVKQVYAQQAHVKVVEFIQDMAAELQHADLVICRSGALTVAETVATQTPAIFIPLPIAVDDHQRFNALSVSQYGGAICMNQQDMATQLEQQLRTLLASPKRLREMRQALLEHDAGEVSATIADYIEALVVRNKQPC